MHRLDAALPLLLLAATFAACDSSTTRSATPTARTQAPTATVAPVTFPSTRITYMNEGAPAVINVEVASTPEQSERGLGYRDALAEDAGMLFDLGETKVPQFWMKGMRFPLDIVWIFEDGRVASILTAVPMQMNAPDADLVRHAPPVAVRYALELNAGAARRLGLAPNTKLTFELPPQ